jgi:hypothetical protein
LTEKPKTPILHLAGGEFYTVDCTQAKVEKCLAFIKERTAYVKKPECPALPSGDEM